jgi:putative ABC transport system permease protein
MTIDPRQHSRLALRDLAVEAGAAIRLRPGRSMLTALGTVVGVGAFVATTGLADTARAQVSSRFDALRATDVQVEAIQPEAGNPFPVDVDERLERLNGVNHAGLYWKVDSNALAIGALPTSSTSQAISSVELIAASPGAIGAARPHLATGRLFNQFHDGRRERVAVLGVAAAQRLSINRIGNHPAIFINDIAYTVIGIIDDVERNPDLLLSVIVPSNTALDRLPTASAQFRVVIDTQPGAAQLIGSQAALALRPDHPERLQVLVPPDPASLRRGVESDVTGLFYALAALALLIGAIGIANTTLIAVIERRGEIGLRRALGAKPRHIASQILTESSALGLIGGLVGAALGILAVVVVSAANGWTTTLNPQLTLASPILGAATGWLAGVQPARRASRTQPAEALRES